jgi:hypothetical protein
MMLRLRCTLFAFMAAGCATPIDRERPLVTYTCGQIVVVGRIENTGAEALKLDDGELAWSSLNSANVHVYRALVGSRSGAAIKITYVSHALLREDVDFMFVLERPKRDGMHKLEGADMMETQPRLAPQCDPVKLEEKA